MARSKAKQKALIAPDGRKILDWREFRKAIEPRLTKRAINITEERDRQSAARSLGAIPMQIKSCKVSATKPDYRGDVHKTIEISVTLPYSKGAQTLITEHLQEIVVAEIKPKQLLMNIKSSRGDGKIGFYDLPEAIQREAQQAQFEDHDIKAAMDDLCVCGHTRRQHFEEMADDDGELLGWPDLDSAGSCRAEGCECDYFVPLAPGEKPTPMTGEADGDADGDDEGGDES